MRAFPLWAIMLLMLVGIVVDFYLDDYINFKIPLPPYAKRALLGLQRGASPYALDPHCLEALLAISPEPPHVGR